MLSPLLPDDKTVASLRREIAPACQPDGCVAWVDAAAEALLGSVAGGRMTNYSAPGHAMPVEQLVRDSHRQPADRGFEEDTTSA